MIEILKAQNYKKMPWKNGLGFTSEVARSDCLDKEDFQWRISIADVLTDGEFSYFAGKHRIISVLKGEGIHLDVDQNMAVTLHSRDVFNFDGASQVYCKLIENPICDLNLIYQPEKLAPRFQWINSIDQHSILTAADFIFILNISDELQIDIQHQYYSLAALDCLKITKKNALTQIQFPQKTVKKCCLIELFLR